MALIDVGGVMEYGAGVERRMSAVLIRPAFPMCSHLGVKECQPTTADCLFIMK